MTNGKLTGVGVGPGDPELLTLKAVRVLREADVVAVPDKGAGERTALSIAAAHIQDKPILSCVTPMVRDKAALAEAHKAVADRLCALLEEGKRVAVITLRDPSIYSTYLYVHRLVLARGYAAELVPGVPSFCAAAARAAGRDPSEVLLVGASKMNDAAACQAAIAAGIDALGENRVQEMTAKLAERAYDGAPLHFIGHLQRNKVRQVVGRAALIHSAGSLALLEEVHRQAEKQSLIQDVLLEVNIGGEESKSGFSPQALYAAAESAREFSHIRVLGLMAIPPAEREPHGNLPYFIKVSQLYVDISRNLYDNSFKYLSMGMSDDFEDAIAAGATIIRVGSAIFGYRQYQ